MHGCRLALCLQSETSKSCTQRTIFHYCGLENLILRVFPHAALDHDPHCENPNSTANRSSQATKKSEQGEPLLRGATRLQPCRKPGSRPGRGRAKLGRYEDIPPQAQLRFADMFAPASCKGSDIFLCGPDISLPQSTSHTWHERAEARGIISWAAATPSIEKM